MQCDGHFHLSDVTLTYVSFCEILHRFMEGAAASWLLVSAGIWEPLSHRSEG
jgi:hypothetical protein